MDSKREIRKWDALQRTKVSRRCIGITLGTMKHVLFFFFLFVTYHLHAQWSYNGIPACGASGQQLTPSAIRATDGSIIVVWADYRGGGADIYAQSFSPNGTMNWTTNGIPLCTASGDQINPVLCSDGSGGAVIAWEDYRNPSSDIYAQRVSSSGTFAWQANGIPVCVAAGQQQYPSISETSNAAIIAWEDYRTQPGNVFAQRVMLTGSFWWTANGIAVTNVSALKRSPKVVTDGGGGGIVVWEDFRKGTESDIYAQRILDNGTISWNLNGLPVCASDYSQSRIVVAASDSGSVLIAWEDFRGNNSGDIYAQRLSVAGTSLWAADGIEVCTESSSQLFPAICSDGLGGVIVAWQDYRNGSDIYTQRVHASGSVLWTTNGAGVCTQSNVQELASIAPDGANGAIVSWTDYRNTIGDIYAQRVSANGWMPWTINGVGVCLATQQQQMPLTLPDGNGGVLITWTDYRALNADIYAQRITNNGIALPIELLSLSVARDGAKVSVRWHTASERNVLGFEVHSSRTKDGPFVSEGFIPSKSTGGAKYEYAFLSNDASSVRLKTIDTDGSVEWSDVLEIQRALMPRFTIEGLAPNPASDHAILRYSLHRSESLTIDLWNQSGQCIRNVFSGNQESGFGHIRVNTSHLTSGRYFLMIQAGDTRASVILIVL